MYKCIIKYLTLVGLEYGDIDVLEDKNGNLYVIDINNAPMGDPYSNNYYKTIIKTLQDINVYKYILRKEPVQIDNYFN